jgi:tetrapyrrole methylase family protein/MazG family protein
MPLTIVGLGPGSVDDLTRRAWRALENAPRIIARTAQHPCIPALPHAERIEACDDLYESIPDFEGVYAAIAGRVLAAAEAGDVVYAVPGDPANAEATVRHIRAGAGERGLFVEVISGVSFVEPTLALLGVDALADGLQLFDAIAIAQRHHPPLDPDHPALLGQVYSRDLASALKLTLMNQYDDEFEVALVHGAGTPEARVERLPLYAIDRSPHIRHLTSLYLPALGGMRGFARFQEIIAHLRAPEGCPWDRRQTHASLRPYVIEEAYEVADAIDQGDPAALADELGDLLLQVVLHAQIGTDDGTFRMGDVLRAVSTKMIRRHPHVWADPTALGLEPIGGANAAEQVVANWEVIKQRERAASGQAAEESILAGVPRSLPALAIAVKYQKRAAKVGFDWSAIDGVIAKVREELDEVLSAPDAAARQAEIGDLLFVVANWARWLEVDPEEALRATNAKFARRFGHIEARARAAGRALDTLTLAEMDAWWGEAKALGL